MKKYFTITERPHQKTSELIAECKKLFSISCYYSDEELDKQFPALTKSTTRYFEANVEADEDLKNMSANDLDKKGINGITLRERLILELEHYLETGEHLDKERIALCSGSRDSGGAVPSVSWSFGQLCVGWDHADCADDHLRARAAVNPIN